MATEQATGGNANGAKRRRLNVPAADTPTVGEWAQQLMKQGPDGGCEGEQTRAGPTTEIPPERNGLMTVTGTNRKGWEEAPRRQLTIREKKSGSAELRTSERDTFYERDKHGAR